MIKDGELLGKIINTLNTFIPHASFYLYLSTFLELLYTRYTNDTSCIHMSQMLYAGQSDRENVTFFSHQAGSR